MYKIIEKFAKSFAHLIQALSRVVLSLLLNTRIVHHVIYKTQSSASRSLASGPLLLQSSSRFHRVCFGPSAGFGFQDIPWPFDCASFSVCRLPTANDSTCRFLFGPVCSWSFPSCFASVPQLEFILEPRQCCKLFLKLTFKSFIKFVVSTDCSSF